MANVDYVRFSVPPDLQNGREIVDHRFKTMAFGADGLLMAIPKRVFNHLSDVETHVLRKGHVLFVHIDHVLEAVGGRVVHAAALNEAIVFV